MIECRKFKDPLMGGALFKLRFKLSPSAGGKLDRCPAASPSFCKLRRPKTSLTAGVSAAKWGRKFACGRYGAPLARCTAVQSRRLIVGRVKFA